VENFKNLKDLFKGRFDIYYAMKANSEKEILDVLNEAGCGFEVSSKGELEVLQEIGVDIKK